MALADRVKTGVPGLDELLNGGIPCGRVVLVVGGPGTGKTVLSTQFLVEGAKIGEGGVFVSLDESKEHLYAEMEKFGWKLAEYEKKKLFSFVDASPIRHLPGEVRLGKTTIGRRDFSMLSLLEGIHSSIREIDAKRVCVDPIASLIFQYPDSTQMRTALLDLVEALVGTGATCFLTTELGSTGVEREVQVEEYLAQGVFILQTLRVGRSFVQAIHVEKMRGTAVDSQPRPYRITNRGIEVFPKESVF